MARGNHKPFPQFTPDDLREPDVFAAKMAAFVRDIELLVPTAQQIPPEDAGFIYTGTGPPAATLGENGDFYFDDGAAEFYRKSGGAWASIGTLNTA